MPRGMRLQTWACTQKGGRLGGWGVVYPEGPSLKEVLLKRDALPESMREGLVWRWQ